MNDRKAIDVAQKRGGGILTIKADCRLIAATV